MYSTSILNGTSTKDNTHHEFQDWYISVFNSPTRVDCPVHANHDPEAACMTWTLDVTAAAAC
jgi:hypothetical protein